MDLKSIFTYIYRTNMWGGTESISGSGSTRAQTVQVIKGIEYILDKYQINRVVDIPCGDFHWMQHVGWQNRQYLGADIVDDLITINQQLFSATNIQFQALDISQDLIPATDLLIVRDLLVHFSFADIQRTIDNLSRCNYRYLLLTHFPKTQRNVDIHTGQWRALNLQLAPWYLPPPIEMITEECTELGGLYHDKCLALWNKENFTPRATPKK